MADGEETKAITTVSTRKETPLSSIQCPMLTTTNYIVWAIRMRVVLKCNKVWETIEPGSTDVDKNNIATALIFQSIPEALVLQVGELDSPKDVWNFIKTRNLGADCVKGARLQTLMSEFEKLKMMESDTIDEFAGKLSQLASKATALGETIEESRLVKKILNSLPLGRYIHIVAMLEQVLDLKTTGYEDIVGRLKTYEERIADDTQGQLRFANIANFSNFRGRGRGREGRGGRGQFNSQERHNYQTDQT